MEVDFSLPELFLQHFGYPTDAFGSALQFNAVAGDSVNNRTSFGSVAGSDYYDVDGSGREYYLPIEFVFGGDIIPGTNTSYKEKMGMSYWNLPYPIFSIESKTHVIDTELTERNGMVSELINLSGYKLNVKGFLINLQENAFPEADFKTLIKLYELAVPLQINNPITDVLFVKAATSGANLVTIRNVRLLEGRGTKNIRAYELELVQEVPFNLIDIS
jgi:hypothetical protein